MSKLADRELLLRLRVSERLANLNIVNESFFLIGECLLANVIAFVDIVSTWNSGMNASFIVPLALIASIGIGFALILVAVVILASRQSKGRMMAAACALMGALTINSWWIAFMAMAFYKLFILREDT